MSDKLKNVILLVEDEPDIAMVLSARLQVNGYRVIHESDGKKGLEAARTGDVDLILTDLMIPKLSGFELCQMLKMNDATKHIPIIVLSGLSDSSDRDKAISAGADAYCIKPFDLDLLLSKIRSLIKNPVNRRMK
ncbi:MAG: two-component system response regulator RpaA [Candidatus Omnitrophota bacterium]|jgi:two-component system response regulator RpaA